VRLSARSTDSAGCQHAQPFSSLRGNDVLYRSGFEFGILHDPASAVYQPRDTDDVLRTVPRAISDVTSPNLTACASPPLGSWTWKRRGKCCHARRHSSSAGQLNGRVLVFVLRCRLCGTMDDDLEQGCMFEGGADSADTDPSCGICLECAAPAPRARAARLRASFGARLTPGRCSRVAGRSRSVARSEAASTSSASDVSSTGRRCMSRPRVRCARWPSARS
jgi:hypothetical protein